MTELLDVALAGGLGSAAAVSIGDAHRERFRTWRGALWRVPDEGPPVAEDSWFDLASLTKPMVSAALAMVYVDRGALRLDEPVRRWVPDAATPASVAELLAHTAGCAAHVKFYEQLAADRLDGRLDDTPAREALLRMARSYPLTGEPGRDTAYSDLGYLLLGELLERVGGARLDALYTSEIAGPLGLGSHYREVGERGGGQRGAESDDLVAAGPDPGLVATELEGGVPIVGQVHDENARAGGGIFGHAGLFGRIGDVAAFARVMLALVDGREDRGAGAPPRLVSAETARTFFTRAPGAASWRLGWDTPARKPGISHAGDLWPRESGVGHLGFTGTSLWLDLARGRWVALLTNRVHPSREGSSEGIKLLRRAVMDTAWQRLEELR